MVVANSILLCLLWLGATFASSISGCDSSTMEVVQTITGPINLFYVGIVSPDWCTEPSYTDYDAAVTLPRFTWTLEPAAEGATDTTVMMSPPDLGTLIYDFDEQFGVGSADGIKINPTLNLTNGTEVGIVVQIPRDELAIVDILGGAPFYVNIANGFTNISSLGSDIGSYDFYCGNDTYQTDIFGRGSSVSADLSSAFDFWSLSIRDDGADWTVKLTDDETSRTELEIDAMNAKVMVQGHLKCTEPYACNLIGGSREGCAENCKTELVVDGSISGNISVFSITPQPDPFWEEYDGNATFIITASDAGGCDHFVLDDIEGTPFGCTVDTEVVVEVEEFPCTIETGVGGPTDILQCQGEPYEGRHTCNCAVPGTCPAPSPAPSSSSSFVEPHYVASVVVSLIVFTCSSMISSRHF